MPIHITKPAFNLRSKLNELEYGRVPYHKMPGGSIIQVSETTTHNEIRGTVAGASGYADVGEGALFATLKTFCPKFSSSKILLQSSNIYCNEYANTDDNFFMTAWVKTSGDDTVHARVLSNMGYESFLNSYNAGVLAFNHVFSAGVFHGKPSETEIRIGPKNISSHGSMQINRDSYAASYSNEQNLVSFTLTEIRQ